VDAGAGEILAHALTDTETADGAMASSLAGRSGSVVADFVQAGATVYAAIRTLPSPRSPPKIVVQPSAPSIPKRGKRLTACAVESQRKGVTLRISPANKAIRHAMPVTCRIA